MFTAEHIASIYRRALIQMNIFHLQYVNELPVSFTDVIFKATRKNPLEFIQLFKDKNEVDQQYIQQQHSGAN